MSDHVDRQAAIRWVKTECNPYGNPTLDFESGKKVIEHLKQMPSAQPDIVRCKDCARYNKKRGCNLTDGLNVATENCFCSYGERRDG